MQSDLHLELWIHIKFDLCKIQILDVHLFGKYLLSIYCVLGTENGWMRAASFIELTSYWRKYMFIKHT